MSSIINYLLFVVVLLCTSGFLQQGSFLYLVIYVTYLFIFLVVAQRWPVNNNWGNNRFRHNFGFNQPINSFGQTGVVFRRRGEFFSLYQTDS
jgi:hypothetical protein